MILHCIAAGSGSGTTGLAAPVEGALDAAATRQPGKLGQFDVVVDGEVIASRDGRMPKRRLGGGWPDPQAVITRIEAKVVAI